MLVRSSDEDDIVNVAQGSIWVDWLWPAFVCPGHADVSVCLERIFPSCSTCLVALHLQEFPHQHRAPFQSVQLSFRRRYLRLTQVRVLSNNVSEMIRQVFFPLHPFLAPLRLCLVRMVSTRYAIGPAYLHLRLLILRCAIVNPRPQIRHPAMMISILRCQRMISSPCLCRHPFHIQ